MANSLTKIRSKKIQVSKPNLHLPGASKPTGDTAVAHKSACYSLGPRGETRMSNHHGTCFVRRTAQKVSILLLVSALFLTCVSPAAAQKKKKTEPPSSTDQSKLLVSLTDDQQIDYMLSEMLGAWQIGDIEKLHHDYGDDVAIVNGSWAPPILRSTNYLAVYQQQRAPMQQERMDSSNTYIRGSGS